MRNRCLYCDKTVWELLVGRTQRSLDRLIVFPYFHSIPNLSGIQQTTKRGNSLVRNRKHCSLCFFYANSKHLKFSSTVPEKALVQVLQLLFINFILEKMFDLEKFA